MKLNQMKKGNMNKKEFEKLSKKWGKLQNEKDFERMFKNSAKSEGEIDDGCLITPKNDDQGYQGDGTEWIYEQDEDGKIVRRKMGSDKKERL